jgi:hypothetical protein
MAAASASRFFSRGEAAARAEDARAAEPGLESRPAQVADQRLGNLGLALLAHPLDGPQLLLAPGL